MSADLHHYPPNPDYGGGVFRRRIAYERKACGAQISLLDEYHDMAMAIVLAEGVISDVRARMDRYPKTSCQGAMAALGMLKAQPAAAALGSLSALDRSSHCTHLVDLARLCLGWLLRDEPDAVIEVALTDRDPGGCQRLDVRKNGTVVVAWVLQDEILAEPRAYQGQSLFGGFSRWVTEQFDAAEAELWRIAQMAVFVARGRAYIVDSPVPRRVSEEPLRRGACYSFSGARFETAYDNMDYVRDMSDGLPPLEAATSPCAREGEAQ
ncbi:DUF2889 domain-containing protein [Novosphingobium piscinae]|uniref:DUF2889 domain-containing protein n=1 Tax=Novosphingobium piscinae TaxID=1507448 RepID=A0A7X1FYX1_9SPHN|nr:DUF2889 domain-containing protein [Novosphingobium piscinae]MBC2669535.1 DUF2889 domain-containing protein [Novosphingobium piscinae]